LIRQSRYTEEYVEINGISQYFLHYPSKHEEVALVLHGGPGQSEAQFAYYLSRHWDFSNLVYYDQRGAGKTQLRSKSKPNDVTLETLLLDLQHTIKHLKTRYQTNRIILIGHSWGSVLGTQYALQYPNDLLCYIGYGQVIDMMRGEKIAFDKMRAQAEQAGAGKSLRELNALGNYPYGLDEADLAKTLLRVFKLKSEHGLAPNKLKSAGIALRSPVFRPSDIGPLRNSLKMSKNLIHTLLHYSIWDTVEYQLPVFYVLGRNDWQTPSTLAAEYFERIEAPQKGLYWIEEAGHLADIENPVDFCKAIREGVFACLMPSS